MPKKNNFCAALIVGVVTLWSRPVAVDHRPRLILWQVGQGQWTTYSTMTACYHLDMGGERAPWSRILAECRDKMNAVSYSHWDWDHLSFTRLAGRKLRALCLSQPPPEPQPHSLSKVSALAQLPSCSTRPTPWRELYHRSGERSANAASRVMVLRPPMNTRGALIPGDSPATQEKIWAPRLASRTPVVRSRNPPSKIRLLILGHHGSRTSTSPTLLKMLPHLRLAWVSARRRRYGHPHPQVGERLKRQGVPLLRTEDWGTLVWLL